LPAPDGPVRKWNEPGARAKLTSVSTSGPPPLGLPRPPKRKEGPGGAFCDRWLMARGWNVRTQEVTKGRANVWASRAGNGVTLSTHLDTVPPYIPPKLENNRLYGRGAADDKAGILAHIAAYAAVTRVLGDDLGLGVTFFFEGEEEAGSPTFRTFLETHRELLRADVIVVADSSNWKVGIPALTTSLRGLVDGTIEVQVLDHAVHSGMFGGPVLDAPTLLSRLIATLHDDEGNVAIAGLVSRDDATVDLSEEEYRADASVLDGVRLAGTGTIASRMWTKPALSIIGFDAPAVDVTPNPLHPRDRGNDRRAGRDLHRHALEPFRRDDPRRTGRRDDRRRRLHAHGERLRSIGRCRRRGRRLLGVAGAEHLHRSGHVQLGVRRRLDLRFAEHDAHVRLPGDLRMDAERLGFGNREHDGWNDRDLRTA